MDKRFVIGNFICELRREKGWTQKELGDLLGVTNKAVSKWETGAALPRVEYLRDLAAVLGCTQEELFLGRRIPKDKTEPSEPPEESYTSVVHRCDSCKHESKWVRTGCLKGKLVCKNCGAELKNERGGSFWLWSLLLALPAVYRMVLLLNSRLKISEFFASEFYSAEQTAFFRQLHEHFPNLKLIGLLADFFMFLSLYAVYGILYYLIRLLYQKKHWIKYRIVHYPHSEDGKIVF